MRRFLTVILSLAFILPAIPCVGQSRQRYPMYFSTEGVDTTFLDVLEPAWCLPRGRSINGADWRRYYKLVYNFNKVYPYALVGRKLMAQVDRTLATDVTKRSERTRYINDVEKELLRLFEKDIRKMTISQGVVLLRLVDRECGMSGYEIIRSYESGFAAGFWQMVARMFSQDLKTRYEPNGRDRQIEEMVRIWDSGDWDSFYYSIFMEKPVKTVIAVDELKSEVQKKSR